MGPDPGNVLRGIGAHGQHREVPVGDSVVRSVQAGFHFPYDGRPKRRANQSEAEIALSYIQVPDHVRYRLRSTKETDNSGRRLEFLIH